MSKGLESGSTLPDFRLNDDGGAPHRLSEIQGENCLVLLLGRGEHCPRERQHQKEMVRFHEWCPVAFTEMVTVLPGVPHDTLKMRIATGAHWPFLVDEDLEVQRALEIDEYTDTHHAATVPHTVILSPGLRIEKVYVGYWFWGRPSIYDLWSDLREIHQRIKDDYDPTTAQARAAFRSGG